MASATKEVLQSFDCLVTSVAMDDKFILVGQEDGNVAAFWWNGGTLFEEEISDAVITAVCCEEREEGSNHIFYAADDEGQLFTLDKRGKIIAKGKGRDESIHITYDLFKCQPYILSPIFSNNDVNLLHSLRGRMINCKANFRGRHGDEVSCPLCDDGSVDDQPHILVCPKIVEKLSVTEIDKYKVKYEDIFGDVSKQKEATVLFRKMLDIRKSLLEDETQSLPVAIMTGP